MRSLLTTQSQNCYREQIEKEMLTRLVWRSRYAKFYPTNSKPGNPGTESTQPGHPPAEPRAVLPPVARTPEKQRCTLPPPPFPPPPPPPPPVLATDGEERLSVAPLMRPASPQTRDTLYQGKGRRLYMQRRGQIKPEEKFEFPLLSSWDYGWRLGNYNLDYRTPSRAKSSVVRNTFYARNGVFSSSSATDTLG